MLVDFVWFFILKVTKRMQLFKNRYFAEGQLLTLYFNNACSEKKDIM